MAVKMATPANTKVASNITNVDIFPPRNFFIIYLQPKVVWCIFAVTFIVVSDTLIV